MSLVEDLADRLPFLHRTGPAAPSTIGPAHESAANRLVPPAIERFFAIPASGPNGFDILVWSDNDSVSVCFGGLEQKFNTTQGARIWIDRAMTQDCTLRIDHAGKRPYRWTLTYNNPDRSERDQLISGQGSIIGLFAKKWSSERRNDFANYEAKHKTIPIHLLGR